MKKKQAASLMPYKVASGHRSDRVLPAKPIATDNSSDGLLADKIRLIMKLRRSGITDTAVLAAIEHVPRDLFVPQPFSRHAYDDQALPIEKEQTISQPTTVALMTQALALEPRHVVLEIGTGSGYQAAILAMLSRRVHTIERFKTLHQEAVKRFDALKLRNITAHCADGAKGWLHAAPYDRIIVTAAAEDIPPILYSQLAVGGIMIVPVGAHVGEQQLLKVTKLADDIMVEPLSAVRFVPLLAEVAE